MFGSMRAPHRRYVLRVAGAMACYMVTLAIGLRLIGHDGARGAVAGPLAYLIAVLPGLSVAGVFWALGRLLVEETDEYQRMLLVRQTLVATALTLTVATIWGFLENFGLVAHVDGFYVAMLWFFGLGVGALYNRVTLGAAGGCA